MPSKKSKPRSKNPATSKGETKKSVVTKSDRIDVTAPTGFKRLAKTVYIKFTETGQDIYGSFKEILQPKKKNWSETLVLIGEDGGQKHIPYSASIAQQIKPGIESGDITIGTELYIIFTGLIPLAGKNDMKDFDVFVKGK